MRLDFTSGIVQYVEALGTSGDVYDIAVDGARHFFANGILVHNCDEIASWRYEDAWTQIVFGNRLGNDPRRVATTTPRPLPLLKKLLANPRTIVTGGSTFENAANLSPDFLIEVREAYEGTTLGRQELYAELLDDVEGALWKRSLIDLYRFAGTLDDVPALKKVAVAVDPATTFGENSDETGIAVAGLGHDGEVYVLHGSGHRDSPQEWAMRAVGLYEQHAANEIVAESNQGGEMVRQTILNACKDLPMRPRIQLVHAKVGKRLRAEPVVALYEQGRVHHVGMFGTLEDQMVTFPLTDDDDMVDALVHAITAVAPAQRRGLRSY